jgi:branched-chain amino acid aminotransferase
MNILFLNGSKREDLYGVSFYNPTFLYGINCFEGIRAYWNATARQLIFLDLQEHLHRLYRSAEHMSIDPPLSLTDLHQEVLRIAGQDRVQEDVYVRITFFLGGDGSWYSQNDIHYMISIRSMVSELGTRAPAALGITRFRRIAGNAMPPHVKAGANYLNSRYAMLDARNRGFDDALFLTSDGLVCEATGSSLFLFRNGEIHTPSLECDILPSITRARIIQLCTGGGLRVQQLKITQEQLASYDGAVLTGTMVEIRPVSRLENWIYQPRTALHDRLVSLLRQYVREGGPGKSCVAA